jgi:hypothetical protein
VPSFQSIERGLRLAFPVVGNHNKLAVAFNEVGEPVKPLIDCETFKYLIEPNCRWRCNSLAFCSLKAENLGFDDCAPCPSTQSEIDDVAHSDLFNQNATQGTLER